MKNSKALLTFVTGAVLSFGCAMEVDEPKTGPGVEPPAEAAQESDEVALAAGDLEAGADGDAGPDAGPDAGLLWLGEHQSMGGRNCGWAGSQPNLRETFCFFGDKASSVENNNDRAWVLYDDAGYQDTRYCVRPGQRVNDLHDYGFGDKISSIKRLGTTSCAGYPVF